MRPTALISQTARRAAGPSTVCACRGRSVSSRGRWNGRSLASSAIRRQERVLGVAAAVDAALDKSRSPLQPQIFEEFALSGRVGVVSGGNQGLGLEMALVLAEQGAHVYAIDLPTNPSNDFRDCAAYAERLGSSMHYIPCDVTDKAALQRVFAEIAAQRGRLDVCVAAAGLLGPQSHVLEYDEQVFKRIMDVNTTGVFLTAQAAAQQMVNAGNGGSIILIASMSGSIVNRDHAWVAYNTSKSAVLQLARSMACELGPNRVRVNTISPGHIYTKMTAAFLDKDPSLLQKWSVANPLGRIGLVHEIRGVTAWLASDASTFATGSDVVVSGGHHAW